MPIPWTTAQITPRTESPAGVKFSLWAIPGRKTILHGRSDLLLTAQIRHETFRVSMDTRMREGSAFQFRVPASEKLDDAWRTVTRTFTLFASVGRPEALGAPRRPKRQALLHARLLQALDGQSAGASHREIASAIFGDDEVWQRWGMNSELRAQLRYLLRRGHYLVSGGYRQLLARETS